MKYCFDIDDTILQTDFIDNKYYVEKENKNIIKIINRLFNNGNVIILHTARHWDQLKATIAQVERAGVEYTTIVCGKPTADYYVDDKALRPEEFTGKYGSLI